MPEDELLDVEELLALITIPLDEPLELDELLVLEELLEFELLFSWPPQAVNAVASISIPSRCDIGFLCESLSDQ